MVACEVCGSTDGMVYGKTGKFGTNLCNKHRIQMRRHGKVLIRTRLTPNEVVTNGEITTIYLYDGNNDKTAETTIDTYNLDKIINHKWSKGSDGYVVTQINKRTVGLHRVITNAPDGMVVDHINHNVLDNRASNLRVCTRQENSFNYIGTRSNTSGATGVCWYERYNKWMAKIRFNGKNIFLGYFMDKEDAINARKEAEIKYFGDFRYKGELCENINRQ